MRRLSYVLTVAAAVLVLPAMALAANQEVAERVAANLRASGQLEGYKIGVKYQEGTAWLRGRVSSHEQMNAALRVAFQTQGVERVVNNLTVDATAETAVAETAAPKQKLSVAGLLGGPLRHMSGATAPERRAPTPWAEYERTPTSQVTTAARRMEAAQAQVPQASPVATAFDAMPALPASALSQAETPELAPQSLSVGQPVVHPMAYPVQQPAMPAGPIGRPVPVAYTHNSPMTPTPQYVTPVGAAAIPARYDQPNLPNYAWPSYAAHPNYAAVTYPKQYSPTAWPYIGPFYPYPQVPLGWRKVMLEWDDGWWHLDFDDGSRRGTFSGLFRPHK